MASAALLGLPWAAPDTAKPQLGGHRSALPPATPHCPGPFLAGLDVAVLPDLTASLVRLSKLCLFCAVSWGFLPVVPGLSALAAVFGGPCSAGIGAPT